MAQKGNTLFLNKNKNSPLSYSLIFVTFMLE